MHKYPCNEEVISAILIGHLRSTGKVSHGLIPFDLRRQRVACAAIAGNKRLSKILTHVMVRQNADPPKVGPLGKQRSRYMLMGSPRRGKNRGEKRAAPRAAEAVMALMVPAKLAEQARRTLNQMAASASNSSAGPNSTVLWDVGAWGSAPRSVERSATFPTQEQATSYLVTVLGNSCRAPSSSGKLPCAWPRRVKKPFS